MATKSKKPEKAKKASRAVVTSEKLGLPREDSFLPEGTGIGDGCEADKLIGPVSPTPLEAQEQLAIHSEPPPQALSLPLLKDSATLFLEGLQQLTAQLLGTPECAPLLVSVNGWLEGLSKVKKLIVGDDDKVEGLKKLVVETGALWGERGSKQLVLAGAVVKVKAVNHRDPDAALAINDLDAAKVEAYLRGAAADPEKTLAGYMKMTPTWGLKDLSPLQHKNLSAMLADPGEWGQGLRQCLKETKYQMMAPEMENA